MNDMKTDTPAAVMHFLSSSLSPKKRENAIRGRINSSAKRTWLYPHNGVIEVSQPKEPPPCVIPQIPVNALVVSVRVESMSQKYGTNKTIATFTTRTIILFRNSTMFPLCSIEHGER